MEITMSHDDHDCGCPNCEPAAYRDTSVEPEPKPLTPDDLAALERGAKLRLTHFSALAGERDSLVILGSATRYPDGTYITYGPTPDAAPLETGCGCTMLFSERGSGPAYLRDVRLA
jgi:hypothetical protein